MSHLPALPVLWPLVAAVVLIFLGERPEWQKRLSLLAAVVLWLLSLSLILEVQDRGIWIYRMGHWPPPYGIVLVVDRLAALLILAGATLGVAVQGYALATFTARHQQSFGFPLMHLQVLGVNWCFLTGDLFNLFVGVEVMLMASYVLVTLGGAQHQVRHGTLYLTLNLLSSTLFLMACALVYGSAGTLNMAQLSHWLAARPDHAVMRVAGALILGAFGIKAALFPLYVWLPNAYAQAPTAVTTLLAGLLTKVGIYVLIRSMTLLFQPLAPLFQPVLLIAGGLTMLIGVLGAAAQTDIKKIFSIHIVSQIGYMVFGIGVLTPLALAGTILHMVHNMMVKCALFLVGGIIEESEGARDLKKLGGLWRRAPALSALFMLAALSLAGLPPLSGFFSKVTILVAGVQGGYHGLVIVGIVTGFLTLFSMMKIWRYAFWEGSVTAKAETILKIPFRLWWPAVLLVSASVVLALATPAVLRYTLTASKELLEPEGYIRAVLETPGGLKR